MPNHLADETSPYLLQHLDNPVDWYPWGEQALSRAKKENKPILLSIGYAACHWCHVMAHESFEDDASAELMNRWFINIKVDREERPDLDSIYMSAVTSMTGQGGWPMTVFLTPDGKPFFSGTYFPPEPRHGMPAFRQVLSGVADAWENRSDELLESAEKVTQGLQAGLATAVESTLDDSLLEQAKNQLSESFDSQWGGFGNAPKFPQPMVLEFLIREVCRTGDDAALSMLTLTLHRMAKGGIYDQLGGGFARYSTDQQWLAPHFEKMLYDNAQLARVYLRAYQVTGQTFFRTIVEQTLDYVLTEMTHADGGFYSSQDADSEGVEGKFFVWDEGEIRQVLGEDFEVFAQVFGVSEGGNWEGKNILQMVKMPQDVAESMNLTIEAVVDSLDRSKTRMYQHRSERIWPGLDDKILVSWNGLMLGAFAEAGRVLMRDDYIDAAVKNAQFLQRELKQSDGRLLRTWKSGHTAKYNGYLEDYACLAEALLTLYETTFDDAWFEWSEELASVMIKHFKNPDKPGFYDTSDDHEQLIHRPRDIQDNAMPSGNAKASMVLYRLGLYQGTAEWLEVAEEALSSVAELLARYPAGFGEWLNLASFMLGRPRQLALIGTLEQLKPFRKVVDRHYQSHLVVAAGDGANAKIAMLADRSMVDGKPAAYVCENFTCRLPVTEPKELARQLKPENLLVATGD